MTLQKPKSTRKLLEENGEGNHMAKLPLPSSKPGSDIMVSPPLVVFPLAKSLVANLNKVGLSLQVLRGYFCHTGRGQGLAKLGTAKGIQRQN